MHNFPISKWNNSDTSGKAQHLQKSLLDGEFITALSIFTKLFESGPSLLTKQLQKVISNLRSITRLAN